MFISSKKIQAYLRNAILVALLSVVSFASVSYAATVTLPYTGNPIDFFTVPADVTSLTVNVTAGGAGGGGGAYSFGGGGGGAGASFSQTIPVTPGQVIAYTIGAGGTGGTSGFINLSGGQGGNGGNTTFGTTTAFGGNGGKGATYGISSGGMGGASGGVGGTNGTNGDDEINAERNYGGNGGTTSIGTGGVGGFGDATTYILPTPGTNGNGGGAGSGWASGDGILRDAGANGGNGLITVSYTLVAPILTTLTISPINPTMMVGSTTVFTASTTDQFGNPFATTTTWTSSSSTIGTINPATGLFTALSAGTTTITATAGMLSTSTVVTVSNLPPVLAAVTIIPQNPTVLVGGTMSFTASTTDQYGNPITPILTEWVLVGSNVGNINSNSGLFSATEPGTATIEVLVSDGIHAFFASTTVTVSNPAPILTSISIAPLNPTVSIGQIMSFTASTTDQYGNPFATTTTWTSSSSTIGTIDPVTGVFNGLSVGTTTITATAGALSTSTIVTVSNAIVPPVNTISITNSTVEGTYYLSYATTSGAIPSLTGTTTVTNSTTTLSPINNSAIATSTATSTTINDVNLNSSAVSNSTLTNDDITQCTIINSSVTNYLATNCYIAFSVLDPSPLYSFISSTSTGSQIYASNIDNSVITNSYIATSTATNATITDSTSTNSTIISSTVDDFSTVASSTLTNVNIASSTITNTILSDATTTNAVIDNGYINSGTITIGGNTYVITTPTLISSLSPTVPVSNITVSASSTTVVNGETLQMIATVLPVNASTSTVAWSIANGTGSATIDTSGLLTATAVGTVTVTASSTDGSDVFGTTTITVISNGGGSGTPVLTSISILPLTPTTAVGSTTAFTATTLDQNGNPFATTTTWTSSDTSVGTIDANGIFSALSAGTTTVSAMAGSLSTSTIVTVFTNTTPPDTTPPVITILGLNPITFVASSTEVYVDAGATAVDSVDGVIPVTTASDNVNLAVVGTYQVVYTATDSNGNTATSTRVVDVVATPDTTPPVITILGSNPDNVLLGSTYVDQGATAFDSVNGDITQNIITTNNVNTNATGTYSVIYTVTDGAGNVASSTRIVNVITEPADLVAPIIYITGGTPITVTLGSTYTDLGALAYDAYDNATTTAIVVSNDVNTAATGTYAVVYSATDAGNTAYATRTVDVIARPANTTPPVIYIIGGTPITIQVSTTSPYTDQGALAYSAYDNATTTATTTSNNVDPATIGSYSVVYSATDLEGNTSTATRTVNVVAATTTVNNIPPVIYITGGTPITIYQGSTYTDQGALAYSAYDNATTTATTTSNNVDPATIGSYSVVYSATDLEGNTSTATRTVNVVAAPVDTTPPVITLNGGTPITIVQGSTYHELGATATDAVDGTDPVVITGSVDTSTIGTYIITYTATDHAGNVASTTRTVNVIAPETIPPVITVLGQNPVSVIKTLSYTDAGATALDGIDGDITSKIITTGLPINTNVIGSYTVTYTVTDSSGLSASSTRVVNVIKDNIPPVITILGANPTSIDVGSTYVDAGATATDLIDGNLTSSIVTNDPISSSTPIGQYFVTYTVTDAAGNTAIAKRTVNVVPTTPPTITLLGSNPDTVDVGTPYIEAGATAVDNIGDNITSKIVISGFVNANILGTYTVTYTVTDDAGNTATADRTVNVVAPSSSGGGSSGGSNFGGGATENTPPTIVILGQNPASITVGSTYIDAGAKAYDANDNTITSKIITTNTVNSSVAGTYTVKYSVTDSYGNTTTATRTVNVVGTNTETNATPATSSMPVSGTAATSSLTTPAVPSTTGGGTETGVSSNNSNGTIPFINLGNTLPANVATTTIIATTTNASSTTAATSTPTKTSFVATVALALSNIPRNLIAILLSLIALFLAGFTLFKIQKS